MTERKEVQQISLSRPQAAKVHFCHICGRPIAIGEEHIRQVIKDYRTFPIPSVFAVRYHLKCDTVLHD